MIQKKVALLVPAALLSLGLLSQSQKALADTDAQLDNTTTTSTKTSETTSTTEVTTPKVVENKFVGQVTYNGKGKVALWALGGNTLTKAGKYVANNSRYKVFSEVEINGKTYYNLGGNQWIDGQYLKVADTTTTPDTTTSTTEVTTPKVVENKFVDQVTYNGKGKVALWALGGNTLTKAGKYVANNSRYKVFSEVEINGKTYYNLGGNQWIDGQYLKVAGTTTTPDTTTEKPATVVADVFVGQVKYAGKGKVALWQVNVSVVTKANKYVPNAVRYKVFSHIVLNGKTYYNLGGNQWIDGQYLGKATAATSHTKAVSNEDITIKLGTTLSVVSYQPKAGIAVYSFGNNSMNVIANKYLKNGTSWKVFERKDVKGYTYYSVGGNQWVSSTYVVLTNPEVTSIKLPVTYVSQYSPVMAPWGCASAALLMLLSYDGVSTSGTQLKIMQDNLPMFPTDGGQKGNVYTGAGFGWVINSKDLTKYAQKWSSKVKDVSGISAEGIKKLVLGGHPVLYFGWSSYQNLNADKNRNHCKVIVGYKDGKFLTYDPLYWPNKPNAGQGGTRETGVNNGYDLGAVHYATLDHFNAEYNGNAMTI